MKYKQTNKYHSKRWITRLMGRWRTQQTVRHRVNCRTHEHRHFERILRSMLLCTLIYFRVLLGLHMVEGCKTMLNKLLVFFGNLSTWYITGWCEKSSFIIWIAKVNKLKKPQKSKRFLVILFFFLIYYFFKVILRKV